ncbi:MAG TPA: antibiotic biosynthesis monooxygenase family protein [Anaerolineales bacterium]|nr:antibiotic biosynthesis monooxygenase family protein [Anaerolineales bacterium]
MIERHVVFHLQPGAAQAFDSFFQSSYGPALAHQPGFFGAELLRPQDDSETLVLVLRFSGVDAAQAWRESAKHKELSPRLKELYQSSDVRVHDVLAVQPGPGPSL